MDWRDEGIVLSARKHGEGAAIVSLLTAEHGRHSGLVRGGAGRRARGIYQPGNKVAAAWRARLEDHLGTYSCELIHAYAAPVLSDPVTLAGLSAACAVSESALAEREPHPALFRGLEALVAAMAANGGGEIRWGPDYVRWELAVLREAGFGLDLTSCAATGATGNLVYVSPKSGQAVSGEAGARHREKLLPLPNYLLVENSDRNGNRAETDRVLGRPPRTVGLAELRDGLALTGYFLERHVFAAHNKGRTPAARTRFVDRIRKLATISGE
jgi:DNA repair protein RecO (recombination protein O)